MSSNQYLEFKQQKNRDSLFQVAKPLTSKLDSDALARAKFFLPELQQSNKLLFSEMETGIKNASDVDIEACEEERECIEMNFGLLGQGQETEESSKSLAENFIKVKLAQDDIAHIIKEM